MQLLCAMDRSDPLGGPSGDVEQGRAKLELPLPGFFLRTMKRSADVCHNRGCFFSWFLSQTIVLSHPPMKPGHKWFSRNSDCYQRAPQRRSVACADQRRPGPPTTRAGWDLKIEAAQYQKFADSRDTVLASAMRALARGGVRVLADARHKQASDCGKPCLDGGCVLARQPPTKNASA